MVFRNWILWYTSALHTFWGLIILANGYFPVTAGLAPLESLIPNWVALGIALVIAGLLGFYGAHVFTAHSSVINFSTWVTLVPQLFFLLLAQAGSVNILLAGHYADGVVRSLPFMLIDQLPYMLLPIFYALAILSSSFKTKDE